MLILNFLYSYLSEGYSVVTMILCAGSSLTLTAALIIGFNLGRRSQAMGAGLLSFGLLCFAVVTAADPDHVASKFVAMLIWKIIQVGLAGYLLYLAGRKLQQHLATDTGDY